MRVNPYVLQSSQCVLRPTLLKLPRGRPLNTSILWIKLGLRDMTPKLFTLEMGSRGVPHLPGFEDLARDLGLHKRQLDGLLEELARHALAGSFSIWCARNKRP